jgi:hypothetical protein
MARALLSHGASGFMIWAQDSDPGRGTARRDPSAAATGGWRRITL